MLIQEISSPNFNAKLNTAEVLETTSQKIFYSDGTNGLKKVIFALNDKPFKATGAKGYRYYAKILGDKIMNKYPQIKEATDNIHKIFYRALFFCFNKIFVIKKFMVIWNSIINRLA